jgi:hypothetical protein
MYLRFESDGGGVVWGFVVPTVENTLVTRILQNMNSQALANHVGGATSPSFRSFFEMRVSAKSKDVFFCG